MNREPWRKQGRRGRLPHGEQPLAAVLLLLASLVAACDDRQAGDVPARVDAVPIAAKLAWQPVAYPLQIDPTGRHLVDRNGTPVLLHGEAAWSLLVQLDLKEAELYLEDRRRMGFNAIYVNLIDYAFSFQSPPWKNKAGEPPFAAALPNGQLDFTDPNEVYWQQVDRVLAMTQEKGMLVIAFPAYIGYALGEQGWAEALRANGPGRVGRYGAWLGRRYAGQANIIWALGGDWRTYEGEIDLTAEVNALAQGLRSADPLHLMTAHSYRDRSAIDDYDQPWLDLNTTYGRFDAKGGRTTIPAKLRDDYLRSPTKPFFLIEGHYENNHGMTTAAVRAQAYWTMLGGAFGHFYGNWPIWSFGASPEFGDDRSLTWQQALRLEGAQDMVHLGDLLRSRPFASFVPDYEHAVLTTGYGRLEDASYAACARALDGGSLVAYLPDRREVSLDLTKIAGLTARAWWFDPRNGQASSIGTFPTEGLRVFRPPSDGDWVLVIDDAARDFPQPGGPPPGG